MSATPSRGNAVLVIDDDVDLRTTLAEIVETTGRAAFLASDGSEALRLLDGAEIPRPCLILLDWAMRPMGGHEFLPRLQARGDAAQLPVLIISATANLPPSAVTPGVLGTIRKPFDIEELEALLDKFC